MLCINKRMNKNTTLSITFGDCAENHVGMQKISSNNDLHEGYTIDELKEICTKYEGVYIDLNKLLPSDIIAEEAGIVIIKNGVNKLFNINTNELYLEQINLKFDKKAKMKGKIVNKKARYNLCYGDFDQDPNYELGQGTVVNFANCPKLNYIRDNLPKCFGKKCEKLVGELNVYYDINKTGISYHGDTERKIVVCIRLGATMSLHYQWYKNFKPIGNNYNVYLDNGDIYIMSNKAVGYDWKKSSIYTLRHAAGSFSYTNVQKN